MEPLAHGGRCNWHCSIRLLLDKLQYNDMWTGTVDTRGVPARWAAGYWWAKSRRVRDCRVREYMRVRYTVRYYAGPSRTCTDNACVVCGRVGYPTRHCVL